MPWDGDHGKSSGRADDVARHRRSSETATNRGSLRAVHSRIDATLGPGAASKCCRCAGHDLARPPIACLTYQGLRASRARRPYPWLNTDAPSGACPRKCDPFQNRWYFDASRNTYEQIDLSTEKCRPVSFVTSGKGGSPRARWTRRLVCAVSSNELALRPA